MTHVSTELLQRYLAGEADLTEMESTAAHLAECGTCSNLLAELAADDAALTTALRLDDADLAWAAGLDLTRPVLQEISPLRSAARPTLYVMLFLLPVAWLMNQSLALVSVVIGPEGPVDTTLNVARTLVPGLWELGRYLLNGGLLISLWPVLALGAIVWFWRNKTTRGGSQPPAETV